MIPGSSSPPAAINSVPSRIPMPRIYFGEVPSAAPLWPSPLSSRRADPGSPAAVLPAALSQCCSRCRGPVVVASMAARESGASLREGFDFPGALKFIEKPIKKIVDL
ncbi:hypothetical protein EJB05_57693, partial [Eragrostis curvula]